MPTSIMAGLPHLTSARSMPMPNATCIQRTARQYLCQPLSTNVPACSQLVGAVVDHNMHALSRLLSLLPLHASLPPSLGAGPLSLPRPHRADHHVQRPLRPLRLHSPPLLRVHACTSNAAKSHYC